MEDATTADNEPATVQRKTAYAMAVGAAVLGLLVGLAIALRIARATNQTGLPASAQTVTSTVTVSATTAPTATAPTVTVAPTTTSTQQPMYSGPGAFAVGTEPRGGLTAAIPPGRYRAEVRPGIGMGSVMRCNDLLCGPGNTSSLIAGTPVFEGGSTLVDILPSDAAVYLLSVTLTRVG